MNPPIDPITGAKRFQTHLRQRIQQKPCQIPLRKPVSQTGWHQVALISIKGKEVAAAHRLPRRLQDSLRIFYRHVELCARRGLSNRLIGYSKSKNMGNTLLKEEAEAGPGISALFMSIEVIPGRSLRPRAGQALAQESWRLARVQDSLKSR